MRRKVRRAGILRMALAGGAMAAPVLLASPALAQMQFGQIQGTVTNKDTGRPFPGVTIVVTGPALQGDQTEITDKNGRYLITQLPSGDNFIVRFYFNDVVVERPGVRIAQNKTLNISVAIPTHKGSADKIVVRERAPNVDTANATTGVEVNQELLQNTAVRGRTFESVMSLAPGSADVAPRGVAGGDVGVSFGGSVGNENSIIIDGLNTTDLNTGVVATQLHQYFIKEVNVITGGYQAEYGRATGGIVSIITKSGSNEFHGGVFGSWAPYTATPNTVARLGEALATRTRQYSQYDFGFELGGPIVKDRVWFYLGFAPTTTITRTERAVRTQVQGMMNPDGTYQAQRDSNYQAPSWLSSPELSRGLDTLALQTNEVSSREVDQTQRIYNWIGKLQFNINPDHNVTLGYIGAPQFDSFYNSLGGLGLRNNLDAIKNDRATQIHDANIHYIGKLLDRKLQLDVLYGFHYQGMSDTPLYPDRRNTNYRASASNPYSLSDFEPVPDCQYVTDAMGRRLFNPCPITNYFTGGYGQYTPTRILQRHAVQASGTLFVNAGGNHAIKLGFDFENNANDGTRKYTGTAFDADPNNPFAGHLSFQTDGTGTAIRIQRGYGLPTPTDQYGQVGVPCGQDYRNGRMATRYCFDHFRASTVSRNYALYLRDSWNVSFIPGMVINAGLRWEDQEVYGTNGEKQINLIDNLSPRIGIAYDPTRKGRAKIYANFGRFYESIPMDINDRAFSGEGFLVGRGFVGDCNTRPIIPTGTRPLPVPEAGPGRPCNLSDPRLSGGGVYAPVAPGLKGQFLDEVVVGGQYDVGYDIVVGAYYSYRHLGNVIEDLSVNGGDTYFIANPGSQPDAKTSAQLETDATLARQQADAAPQNTALQAAATAARNRADVYKAVALFPKAEREYHAVTFTLNKRLSNRFSILANYTYSRLFGNYPGTFNPYTAQLDPNISTQFDIIDLTVNRRGPLSNDRPHNFKATGFYMQPLFGGKSTLTASLTFTALSGRPIQVLGQHVAYGARETFILPSGSGGRTPTITQLDAHIGWDQQMGAGVKLSVFLDVINLLNQQQVINIDDEYTFSSVDPIRYGTAEDLKKLRASDGSNLVYNSNYGQPTGFQAPLYLRFGGRLQF